MIDLAALTREANLPPEKPEPWWERWNVIPIVLCLCIAAAWALGEWRLS
jgi:hypothetical protein